MTDEDAGITSDADRDSAKRRILTLVAEGHLSPSDAAEQLAALDAPTGTGHAGERRADDEHELEDGPGRTGPSREAITRPPGSGPVRRVKIAATARSVVVQGDPDVRDAVAHGGRYQQRYDGDALVIESELDFDDETFQGFRVHRAPGTGGLRHKIVIDGRRGLERARESMREALVIRMHPDLALECEVAAGSLSVDGVRGPVKANVAAGSMRIDDFAGPLDVDLAAGSLKGSGRLDHGDSRISCAMGSVKLALHGDSNVRITAEASLGAVKLPRATARAERGGFGMSDSQEVMIGDGQASLAVEASMGSVKITVDDDESRR